MKTGDLGINPQQCKPSSVLYTALERLDEQPSTFLTGTGALSPPVKFSISSRLSTYAHLLPTILMGGAVCDSNVHLHGMVFS